MLICEDNIEEKEQQVLAYKIIISSERNPIVDIGYINAETGELVKTEPIIQCFSSNGTMSTIYSGSISTCTNYYGGKYHLCDSTRSTYIHVWDQQGANSVFAPGVDYSDNDNNWTSSEHQNTTNIAMDVYCTIQRFYDFLKNDYNMPGMDGNDFSIHVYMNNDYYSNNAFWHNYTNSLYFARRYSSNFSPFGSPGIVSHEYGHGITHFNIGWGNSQRHLNEGMSDIWSVIMKKRYHNNSDNDWMLGKLVMTKDSCLRNIQEPQYSKAKYPIADTYGTSAYNNGDEYFKSGVFSHWYYLLVNGGNGINGLGHSYSVTGVGEQIAESLIVHAVYDSYLVGSASFEDVRAAMENVALDMHNYDAYVQIGKAWYAVGVGDDTQEMAISGNSVINGTCTYEISNLVNNFSVVWSLEFPNTAVFSFQNSYPAANQCQITRLAQVAHQSFLRAKIVYENDTIKTLTKPVYSHNATLTGTCEQPLIPGSLQPLTSPIIIYKNMLTRITSPNFGGMTCPYLPAINSGSIPAISKLFFYEFNLILNNSLTIPFVSEDGNTGFVIDFITYARPYSLLTTMDGDNLVVELSNGDDDMVYEQQSGSIIDDTQTEWIVDIFCIDNASVKAKVKPVDRRCVVNTAGWRPGPYVVMATIEGKTVSKKVVIR